MKKLWLCEPKLFQAVENVLSQRLFCFTAGSESDRFICESGPIILKSRSIIPGRNVNEGPVIWFGVPGTVGLQVKEAFYSRMGMLSCRSFSTAWQIVNLLVFCFRQPQKSFGR